MNLVRILRQRRSASLVLTANTGRALSRCSKAEDGLVAADAARDAVLSGGHRRNVAAVQRAVQCSDE